VNGIESPDGDAPIREDWVFGAEGLSKVAGLVFQMQGTLGIESNAAQPLYLNLPVTVGDVKGYVQAAPTGSGITFTIYVGTTAWLTLTIPAGQTAVVATPSQISALSQLPANTAISIGITAVGTTFPGIGPLGLHLFVIPNRCEVGSCRKSRLGTGSLNVIRPG